MGKRKRRTRKSIRKATPPTGVVKARTMLATAPGPEIRKPWSYRAHMHDTDATTWIMASGVRIKVKDMKPDHLVNTVKMLRRKASRAKLAELLIMLSGPRPSGDIARDAFSNAIEEMADEPLDDFLLRTCPPFRAMLDRYQGCKDFVEAIEAERQREIDDSLYDPWGNS